MNNRRNQRRDISHPYAQDDLLQYTTSAPGTSLAATTRPEHRDFHRPHQNFHNSEHILPQPRRRRRPTRNFHYCNIHKIHDPTYNTSTRRSILRSLLNIFADLEESMSDLLEDLQSVAPDPEEINCEPSNVVNTTNRTPTKVAFDHMGEVKMLLSRIDLSEGGGFGGTNSVIEGLQDTATAEMDETCD